MKLFKPQQDRFSEMQPKEIDWLKIEPHSSFNYVEKWELYDQDKKKFMTATPLRYHGQSIKLTLKGEVVTDGINVAAFDKTVHSLGISLTDSEDLESLRDLVDPFSHTFADFPTSWEVKELLRGDVLYLKLKSKDGQYRFKSDIKMDPENPKKCNLSRKDVIEVKVEMQAYINFKDRFGGFFFDVLEMKTKTTPSIKRRKKDD